MSTVLHPPAAAFVKPPAFVYNLLPHESYVLPHGSGPAPGAPRATVQGLNLRGQGLLVLAFNPDGTVQQACHVTNEVMHVLGAPPQTALLLSQLATDDLALAVSQTVAWFDGLRACRECAATTRVLAVGPGANERNRHVLSNRLGALALPTRSGNVAPVLISFDENTGLLSVDCRPVAAVPNLLAGAAFAPIQLL